MDYVEKGNLFFSAEIEDSLLPQVMDQGRARGRSSWGRTCLTATGSVSPRGMLRERTDISESAKDAILDTNPRRLYATVRKFAVLRLRFATLRTNGGMEAVPVRPERSEAQPSEVRRTPFRRTPFLTMAYDHRFP